MSEPERSGAPARPGGPGVAEIFLAFLLIGATSFGGGVLAYLRSSLVGKHRWVDDPTFVELLAISQSLPGLNSTNVAILVGDRLRGGAGALAAFAGICLPGGLVMFGVGMAYGKHGHLPLAAAVLHGVAAAAVGLVGAVTVQLGRKSLESLGDLVFVALAAAGVSWLHLPVPVVLIGVAALAIWWHRPRAKAGETSSR
jgi:chromate transporter